MRVKVRKVPITLMATPTSTAIAAATRRLSRAFCHLFFEDRWAPTFGIRPPTPSTPASAPSCIEICHNHDYDYLGDCTWMPNAANECVPASASVCVCVCATRARCTAWRISRLCPNRASVRFVSLAYICRM